MNTISRTLALLKPADLFPAWKWIDMTEECGEIEAGHLGGGVQAVALVSFARTE